MNGYVFAGLGILFLYLFSGKEEEKPGEIKKVDPTKKPGSPTSDPKMKEAYDAGIKDAKISIGAYSGLPSKAYYGSYKDDESPEWKAWYRSAFAEYLDSHGFFLDEDGDIEEKKSSIAPVKETAAEKSPGLISTPAGSYKA